MSIYGSLAAPDYDQHEDGCARWDKRGDDRMIAVKPGSLA